MLWNHITVKSEASLLHWLNQGRHRSIGKAYKSFCWLIDFVYSEVLPAIVLIYHLTIKSSKPSSFMSNSYASETIIQKIFHIQRHCLSLDFSLHLVILVSHDDASYDDSSYDEYFSLL